MKKTILFALSLIFTSTIIAQTAGGTETKLRLKTNTNIIECDIVDITKDDLEVSFSPVKSDTLPISLYLLEKNKFRVYSDIDTANFVLPMGHSVILSIEKDGNKPFVLSLKNGFDYEEIIFDEVNKNEAISIQYESDIDNPYLVDLRSKYPIDSLASSESTNLGEVRKIASWVHNLWQHDGMNEPEKEDALYILNEVKKGKRFRCVEYGVVTTACLNSIGIKSRTLYLKTKDSETRSIGAGHVVLEVFLNDLNKWIMVDPQWDVIPHLDGKPLNAVEFQSAITNSQKVDIWTTEETASGEYLAWIYPYLYYFATSLDNRENVSREDRHRYEGKSQLMLVPIGAKNPTVFQQKFPINYCFYTNSLADFYSKP